MAHGQYGALNGGGRHVFSMNLTATWVAGKVRNQPKRAGIPQICRTPQFKTLKRESLTINAIRTHEEEIAHQSPQGNCKREYARIAKISIAYWQENSRASDH